MLAGLSKCPILSVPPDCWAVAPCVTHNATSNGAAVAKAPKRRFIIFPPGFIAAPLDGETAFVVRNGEAISGSPTRLEFG